MRNEPLLFLNWDQAHGTVSEVLLAEPSPAVQENWLCTAVSPGPGECGVTSLCRALKMNSREDPVLKLTLFNACLLPILGGQWTDPPEVWLSSAHPVSGCLFCCSVLCKESVEIACLLKKNK